MSEILPETQPAHEMTSQEIKRLMDEIYMQLQSLKMKAISEFYNEYRKNMIGCLWEFPSQPTDRNRLTYISKNQGHEKQLIWIPINQTLPSIDEFSGCALRELRMILQENPVNQGVRVKCFNQFEHRGYELGLDFNTHHVNGQARDRLMNMMYRAVGNLTIGFDPRYPPKRSGMSWIFRNRYCFPSAGFNKWTASENFQCHEALDNQDLRLRLEPDSEWRYRCLQSSIKLKLSCATDLYKTKSLSVNDIEGVFMMGPKAIGWTWICTSDFPSSKLPNFRYALEGTGKVELNNWKETELEALDKSVEQGSLYLEPINGTSKGDSEIRDENIEEGEIVETISISEVSSRTDEARLSNIETSDDERTNLFKIAIEKLLLENGSREFPQPQDEPWLGILQKHGISRADYTDWLKQFESCNFERPPTLKDNGISSTSLLKQSSSILPSALPTTSVSFQKAKPKTQVPSNNEMISVPETSVPMTVLQIRQEFTDHQSNIFDSVYGQLLDRCTLEANELLEGQHTVQIATLNTKLLEIGQEKVSLEDQILILQGQLEKKSNELGKLKDEFSIKNVAMQKDIDSLCLRSTTAKKEKENVEEERLALIESKKTLQTELKESKARLDEMDLANSNIFQNVVQSTQKKNEAEANSIMWKEKFEAKSWEMGSKSAEWSQAFTNMNTQRLELTEDMNNLKRSIPELHAMNDARKKSAHKTGERIGREMALKDFKFGQEKEFEAIKRAHLEHIQLIRNNEYYRGLKDGQSTQINEKMSKSMAANPTIDRKESDAPDQDVDQNMHKQMAVEVVGYRPIAPNHVAHSPMQPVPIQSALTQPVPIRSPVASTSAPVSLDHFNFDYELELLPPSPGVGTVPSKLSVSNHTFLKEVFGDLQQDFWSNDNMQLMLHDRLREYMPPHLPVKEISWSRFLKVHNDRAPHIDLSQRPNIGKHGALLLIHNLDDKVFVGNEYPTFLNTVHGHAVYIGQYKIVKQIVNDPSVHALGIKFDNYLLKNQLKTQRGIWWSKDHFCNKRPFRSVQSVFLGLAKDRIKTSWTVFEKRGIPLLDVEGGFEHAFLNELLHCSSSKKRIGDGEGLSVTDRKRLKMSDGGAISKSFPVQEIEDLDDSTIVVDVSSRRLR